MKAQLSGLKRLSEINAIKVYDAVAEVIQVRLLR